jgi:hypothetical protein
MADVPGSSPEDGENSIPHSRVQEMIEKAKGDMQTQLNAERQRSQGLQNALAGVATRGGGNGAPAGPAKWTRETLQAKVESNELTPEQAGAIWQKQEISDKVSEQVAGVEQRLRNEATQRSTATTLQSQVDEYKAVIPAVMEDDSEERDRLKSEYQWLIGQGYTQGLHTELLALRAAFGDPGSRKKSRETTSQRPKSREVAGSGGRRSSSGKTDNEGGSDIDLTDRQRAYYQHRVEANQMSWKDVRDRFARVAKRRAERPNQVLRHGS